MNNVYDERNYSDSIRARKGGRIDAHRHRRRIMDTPLHPGNKKIIAKKEETNSRNFHQTQSTDQSHADSVLRCKRGNFERIFHPQDDDIGKPILGHTDEGHSTRLNPLTARDFENPASTTKTLQSNDELGIFLGIRSSVVEDRNPELEGKNVGRREIIRLTRHCLAKRKKSKQF